MKSFLLQYPRLILFITIVIDCSFIHAQTYKSFDCDLFSLEYPSSYIPSPINNAQHMVLKLSSNEYYFSASYWAKGYNSSISIWDKEFENNCKSLLNDNEEIVSIDKCLIRTKNGNHKCLKVKCNIKGHNVPIRLLNYFMINDGFLFIFAFTSVGTYSRTTETLIPDKMFNKLSFKSAKINNDILQQEVLSMVKTLQKQLPIQVDDCTTFQQTILSGKTIIVKTLVGDDCNDKVNFDGFKYTLCYNYSKALKKQFVLYLKDQGYSTIYNIYNEYNKLKKVIQVTADDILKFYEGED